MEFERGNFRIPEVYDPGVRVVWLPVAGGETETTDLDGMTRMMTEWMQSWEQVAIVAERFIDVRDQVVVIAEWRGRGRTSGVVTAWPFGSVWTLRDGKVTTIVSFTDPAEALKAVGLEE